MIRKISWISLISLTISSSSMVIILSVMKSLNHRIQSRLLNTEPHVVLTFERMVSNTEVLKRQLNPILSSVSVEKSIFSVKQDIILRNWNGRFHGAIAIGLESHDLSWYLRKLQQERLVQDLIQAEPGEITMGADLADILGVYPGDQLHLLLPTYLIEAGVELPKLQKVKIGATVRSTVSEIDTGYIFYDLNAMSGSILQTNNQRYLELLVWLWDPNESSQLKEKILKFGHSNVQTWQERNASIFFALKLEKFMIGIFLTLSVLVATFSLVMSLALLAAQKRKDFILLKLLGFSPSKLRQLFVQLSLGLGGLGLLTGIVLGIIVSLYLQFNPIPILPDIYHDSDISAELDIGVTIGLLGGGLLVLLAASLSLLKLLPSKNIGEALKQT